MKRAVFPIVAVLLFGLSPAVFGAGLDLRVGIHDNAPLLADSPPSGIFVDILSKTASRNDWRITYVSGTFEQNMDRLSQGEIDLLPAVDFSRETDEALDFTGESVSVDWAVLYTRQDDTITDPARLNRRRVALVRGGMHNEKFRDLMARLEVEPDLIEYPNYAQVFKAVVKGEVFTGVVSRLYGMRHARELGLRATSILFNPVSMRFAASRSTPPSVLAELDNTIRTLKAEQDPAFHSTDTAWLDQRKDAFWRLDSPSAWGLATLLATLAVLCIWFGRMLYRKSHEVTLANRELHKETQVRKLAQKALWESVERHRAMFTDNRLPQLVIDPASKSILEVNPSAENFYGYPSEQLQTMKAWDINAEVPERFQGLVSSLQSGERTSVDTVHRLASGELRNVEVHLSPLFVEGREHHLVTVIDITERMRVELEVANLARFPEENPNPVLRISSEGRLLYANKACEPLLGCSLPEEIEQCPLPDQYLEMVRQVFSSGKNQRTEFSPGGRTYALTFAPIREAGYVNVYGLDISGQKRTEKALAESEERLSLAVKGGDLGFWDWDIESDELVFNERWAEMLEYEFDELRERFDIWERRLHPDDREAAQAAIWNHVAGKAPEYRAEFRLKVRSGGWRWFVGQGRISSRSPDGRPLRMTGVMYDINERKMTEQGLTMINECMLGFGPDPEENLERLTDLAGKILQADAAFYNRPDVPPYCWVNTWAPDLKREWAPLEKGHISESLFSSRGQKTVVLHDLQDSRFASTDPDVNAFGLRAYAGQAVMIEDRPVAVLATLFRRDFKPNNSNLRLFGIIVGAMRVEEERRMAKEQIVKARDSAEHANRSKSEFLANMSHEIRTPLNGIFGMLQLVRGSELDEEQAEYVETALNSGRNLLRVINDVLDFSKMEAGMLLFENEPFNIGSTIHEVMDTFTVAAREKELRLDVSLDRAMPEVLIGDEARIRQVLFNLLGNAIKFTDRGKVSIEAFTLPAADGKLALHLTITDTGIGIPPDKIQQVFTAFSQADGSHARRYGGTGLGLGIVHRLVSLMGGHIHVDSEPGQGTSIHVFMLVAPGDGKLAPAKITTTPGRDPAAAMTVLLAEDERVNRISVTRQLEKMGHSVICAENGPTVLDKLRKNQVDVVLMDIQMPGMDGLEVTGILRSDPEFAALADVPIVALTAHAMKGDREKFLAAGMDDYLAKPVEFSDLAAILAEIRPRKQV